MEDNVSSLELQFGRTTANRIRATITGIISSIDNCLDILNINEIVFEGEFAFGSCDCHRISFSKGLRNLFNEIMSENSESSKWNAFQSFIKKYAWYYHGMFSIHDHVKPKNCSLKICSVLLHRVELSLRRGIPLPITLKTVIPTVCVDIFENNSSCVIESLKNSLTSSESPEVSGMLNTLYNHSNFVNLLMNFGFISSSKDDSSGFERESYYMICSFMCTWTGATCHSYTKKVTNLTEKAFFYYKDGERFKRRFWAAVAIRAIHLSLRNENGLAKEFVHYLKAYFAATTDLFLTIFEVRSLLCACFTVLEKLDLFDIYSQEFDKLMPECPVEIEPRKLTDLARCQVRKNLKNCNIPLPSAVEKLRLPDSLKSFVLGNITDISRKRKNVSSQEAVTSSKLARLFSQ